MYYVCRYSYYELRNRMSFVKTVLNNIRLYGPYKKGKSFPLQAWSGPQGSRKLRSAHFVKTAQDGGKIVSLTHRPPLPLQEILLVLISVRG